MKIGINQLDIPTEKVNDIVKLEFQKSIEIAPKKPYNFRYTLWKPSHFYTGLEVHSSEYSWRTIRFDLDTFVAFVAHEQKNCIIFDLYANTYLSEDAIKKLKKRIIYSYGLLEYYSIPKKIICKYDHIKTISVKYSGTRISCPENIFEISIISLLLQNTTIKRTTSMFRNMMENYGKLVNVNDIVLYVFFHPSDLYDITETELKEKCRLGYRAKYIKNYTMFFNDNDEDNLWKLSKIELLKRLQSIKGVGPYTSNVVASHALRDTQAIPLDSWNRKILSKNIYNREAIEKDDLYSMLYHDFNKYAGIISTYIIENAYSENPVVPLLKINDY
jgi:3-methyladenine DNA glycosylase/8-oxoguanine DNA glycosylase